MRRNSCWSRKGIATRSIARRYLTRLRGARVLNTAEAETIWRAKTGIFVDVLPRPPKPLNLPAGTIWRDRPRLNIPGSIWLPDTGYGKLAQPVENYLRQGMEHASGGNRAALIVVYCQANCWMSWNAAKRILTYGYPMWPGIPTAPTAGSAPTCRWWSRKPEPRPGEQSPKAR